MISELDRRLCQALRDHPSKHSNRYTTESQRHLVETLFRSLTDDNKSYLEVLFPDGPPKGIWSLRDAQGAKEGAEYTETARGHPCGHIFKAGEGSYRCRTCSTDETCCLCSRCFEASDHTGHSFSVSVSPWNSGCCDCGDAEAWRQPLNCAIHTLKEDTGKGKQASRLPDDLLESIRITIGRVFDYFCDVISCSPEQLRLQKTVEGIQQDENVSRLTSEWYGGGDPFIVDPEYALVLWNDEKHTVTEVSHQVTRACKERERFGEQKANEANDIGRSVIKHSRDLDDLLRISKIIEHIKVTVTVRSSRDTFREQMCGTIIEWLVDIAGCRIGNDMNILRQTICEEMLKPWRSGSEAYNAEIGKSGIDDHERDESNQLRTFAIATRAQAQMVVADLDSDDDDMDENLEGTVDDNEDDEDSQAVVEDGEDEMDLDLQHMADYSAAPSDADPDGDMDMGGQDDDLEVAEATLAGYPPPPPPPPRQQQQPRQRPANLTPTESEFGESQLPPGVSMKGNINIPKTPFGRLKVSNGSPGKHWDIKPAGYNVPGDFPHHEDLRQRVRLDWMVLFDLRLWKKTRNNLRDLYHGTVVNVPHFKRILGLRFAGLYTALAQLYLIADREPDHSIINLSLQMLTTPSITEEVVERGNFLTNLMAILYTFLTTRQVGHPHDVSSTATLAFDAGSVTNRRLYHFFMDLRHMLQSDQVQQKVRKEDQYVLQFLDLVKLPQGICPNVRAVGDHVEYETDAWISASLLTREINRLCRQFSESFRLQDGGVDESTENAIKLAAKATIISSAGIDRKRFDQAEIKELIRFKTLDPFDFETDGWGHARQHRVVDFVVDKGSISFHHALHYTLSWLLECGKSMSRDKMSELLLTTAEEFRKDNWTKSGMQFQDSEDVLMAMFDYPLRVCAWLAQMKAGMWVRNGLSLRHQMSQYRSVQLRDMAHHRDIFLLQTALVTCTPGRVLASIIDRFGMDDWMKGAYRVQAGYEETQVVDIAEDFTHLMIVLLSDREHLLTFEDEPASLTIAIRRDLAHVLCFKPLSFSDIDNRTNDKFNDLEIFQDILEEMTNFRGPEGLNDSGTFELKPEYLDLVDPYGAHYTKNQRDEAESIYRNWMSKKTGKSPSDIVFEPKLRPIRSGAFMNLALFTRTPLFAQVIYFALGYALQAKTHTPNIPATRVETFIQVVLQLVLIATLEDNTDEDEMTEESLQSFIVHALSKSANVGISGYPTIISLLQKISNMEEFSSCNAKIRLILKRCWQKRQRTFNSATASLRFPYDRIDTSSPASNAESDFELKKKQALERQARVMAQFQQQQQKFLDNQGGVDWGEDDFSDVESELPGSTETKMWKYPTGTCILCQEETNDSRLYGTFALMVDSNILRQTDLKDPDFVREALKAPSSMDRSAEDIRPFGVSGENIEEVRRFTANGGEIIKERQILGKGFPSSQTRRGPVTTGCGHIMHYTCFEAYYSATQRRQNHQIARNHPERPGQKEFVCPLCKALGNAFLPIIWKGKEESYPGALATEVSFEDFLHGPVGGSIPTYGMGHPCDDDIPQKLFSGYISKSMPQLTHPLTFPLPQISRSPMPGLFPATTADEPTVTSPLHLVAQAQSSTMIELISTYKRLHETIRCNLLVGMIVSPQSINSGHSEDLMHFDTLARTVGYSISAIEIGQRGVASEPGTTLLDKIPQQTLTHLRILSETAFSYASIGGLLKSGTEMALNGFKDLHTRQAKQLTAALMLGASEEPYMFASHLEPLLTQDIFVFLAECSVCWAPASGLIVHGFDIHHLIRACYMAEIIKVAVAYILEPQGLATEIDINSTTLHSEAQPILDRDVANLSGFIQWLLSELDLIQPPLTSGATLAGLADGNASRQTAALFRRLISNYALPFLRKSIILLHVRYGVEFPNTGFTDLDSTELDRLTRLLRLPTLPEIFSTFSLYTGPGPIKSLAAGWIKHYRLSQDRPSQSLAPSPLSRSDPRPLTLSHPGIFELVGLPLYFDALMEETNRRRCPTTGKELSDPSVCLFCGEIFCSQAVCCMNGGKRGGCNQHLDKCGHDIGLFINIRKCMILYLHNSNGSWHYAPYLDRHGEVDPGLRRNRQLILSRRRYDRLLRDVWLGHGVPATISRKLEMDVNNGGWESI